MVQLMQPGNYVTQKQNQVKIKSKVKSKVKSVGQECPTHTRYESIVSFLTASFSIKSWRIW
jgi:hypothetical protein